LKNNIEQSNSHLKPDGLIGRDASESRQARTGYCLSLFRGLTCRLSIYNEAIGDNHLNPTQPVATPPAA